MFVTFCTLSSPSSRQRVVSRPCRKDKSHRVNCMVIFASNASHFSPCDLFLKTLRMNFSCDKFLRLVPQNTSAVWPLNSWDKSLRPVPSCKLFRGLVAGTSPLVCADLNTACHSVNGWSVNFWKITNQKQTYLYAPVRMLSESHKQVEVCSYWYPYTSILKAIHENQLEGWILIQSA